MVTSNPKKPSDLLFLMPVQMEGERLHRGKIRLLAADADGKVYASVVSRAVYELAREKARGMQARRQPYAIVGLEISPGKFLPTAVGIGPEELWALEHISEHALKSGTLPDILKKYVKPIIGQGEARRGATQLEEKERRRKPQGAAATPRVMERLPYYPDKDIEFSMPIYKAQHSYPFVVLKRLVPESGIVDGGRLLILDNDGDLGVIKLPQALVRKMERNLKQRREEGNYRAVIARDGEGTTVQYLAVSQQQNRALDTITRYFEDNGSGKQPLSMAAKSVLSKARGNPSPSAD